MMRDASALANVEMLPWAQALFKKRVETYATDDPAADIVDMIVKPDLATLKVTPWRPRPLTSGGASAPPNIIPPRSPPATPAATRRC